jgi:hypothetical protein
MPDDYRWTPYGRQSDLCIGNITREIVIRRVIRVTVTTKIERPNAVSIYQLSPGLVPRVATCTCPMQKQDGQRIHRAIDRCSQSHIAVRQGKVGHALRHARLTADSRRRVRLPKSSCKSCRGTPNEHQNNPISYHFCNMIKKRPLNYWAGGPVCCVGKIPHASLVHYGRRLVSFGKGGQTMTSTVWGCHEDAISWPRTDALAADSFWDFAESCKLHGAVTLHARAGVA